MVNLLLFFVGSHFRELIKGYPVAHKMMLIYHFERKIFFCSLFVYLIDSGEHILAILKFYGNLK